MHPGVATGTRIDAAELLSAMLSVPSPSGEEDAVASLLVSRLLRAGFDVDVDAAGNVVAAWGHGPETIALVGHLDTVPGHIDVRRDGDLLHGRGAVDAKGPLATAIAAVSRQPRDGARRFVIVGAVEEETSSSGARHLAESMAAPSSLVILEPSGWDAVTIGYKGSLRLRVTVDQAHAHGAGREPSAPDRCVDLVRALQDGAARANGDAGGFDRVDVRVLRFDSTSDGLHDRASVDLGVRTPPGCDVEALIEVARAAAPTADLCVAGREPGVRTDRSSPLARGFVRAIRAQGGTPRFKLKTGTSDLNVLVPAWGCQAVAYGPGDSQLDHTPREHISIVELERAVSVLEAALGAG
ncbi:MAG TPA: [LysW]-lysine hydrolase [Candidatus Saccharimonadales bacterium]|nr:[LysW]-lysine hydrolase [Candidatus Saccharimonadales bacterium]